MSKSYKLISGSAAEQFHNSRAKVRMYAGGFGNGKTTAITIETLKIVRDYPGISAMLARNTFANLEKTLGREFLKWCPQSWIKSGTIRSGTIRLNNDSVIDMRYLAQSSNEQGDQSSNVLSANYGLIVVDQVEDPDITEKDFDDLLGRLRENTDYIGDDTTMPRTGPRMMLLAANPTLGWVYKKLVKPYHDFLNGRFNDDLMCIRDRDTGKAVLDADGKPTPMIEIFEATTYENAQNLAEDFLQGLEAKYRGKMRDRYLLGKWVAFDGVIYEEFDENIHVVTDSYLREHIHKLRMAGYRLTQVEGYDFGATSPSCYLLALTDADQCTYIIDGFYEPNKGITWQADEIKRIRAEHITQDMMLFTGEPEVFADPQIFKRTNAGLATVGPSTSMMFADEGITMRRGNNDILNGILKVKQYLAIQRSVFNPFTHELGAPKLYVSDKLTWFIDEMNGWRWKKSRSDDQIDKPVDGADHAMDALKYMLSLAPTPGKLVARPRPKLAAPLTKWHEQDNPENKNQYKQHRYGVQ